MDGLALNAARLTDNGPGAVFVVAQNVAHKHLVDSRRWGWLRLDVANLQDAFSVGHGGNVVQNLVGEKP